MRESGLVPNPVARLLLELAARRANGTLEVGGRTLVLHRGAVAEVSAAAEDDSIYTFLVNAGRLKPAQSEQIELRAARGGTSGEPLLAQALGSKEALREARRSVFLDRLVRGLAALESVADGASPRFVETTTEPGDAIELAPFVLDALARRAGEEDAGLVGERASELLVLAPGHDRDLARSWTGLDVPDADVPVYRLLSQSPAAAARVAALLRAGLGQLAQSDRTSRTSQTGIAAAVQPPDPPRTSADEAARAPRGESDTAVAVAAAAKAVPRPTPHASTVSAAPSPVVATMPIELPAFEAPLDDPLDEVERRIAKLEADGAPGSERSRAWADLGKLWQRRHGSLVEAARAFRESASADPTNVESLRQSSRLCAAMGQMELAEAYSSASVAASEGPAKAESLIEAARLSERAERLMDAVGALRAATKLTRENAELWSRLARALRGLGDRNAAIEAGLNAVSLWADVRPQAALAECEWMLELAPAAPGVLTAYARCLAADGRVSAAVAWLADGARALADGAERQQRLVDAAELAEAVGRTDLSAELLLEAFDLDPTAEALHDPLAIDAEAGLPPEDAAVALEALAAATSASRAGEWLHRAARVYAGMPGCEGWSLVLEARALSADPELAECAEALRQTGERTGDAVVVADAFERAIRAGAGATTHLLHELVSLAQTRLGSPQRALWALHRLAALEPSPETEASMRELETQVHMEDRLLLLAEQDLAAALENARPAAARRVAALLRDRPEERRRAIDLYWEAYRADPGDHAVASSLERLLHVVGDDEGLAALYAERFESAPETPEGLRAGAYLAGLLHLRGDAAASGDAAERLFAASAHDRVAAARLERTARALRDPDALVTALESRMTLAATDADRARLLAKLARAHLARGERRAAVEVALEAIELDGGTSDAHTLLMNHLDAVPEELVLTEIDRALGCLGDSCSLLRRAENLARKAGDEARAHRYLESRARLLGGSPEGARIRIALALESGESGALLAAAEQALSLGLIDVPTTGLVDAAIARLAESDPADAATLAVHAIDRLGDPRFVDLAIQIADRSGERDHRVAALERKTAWTTGEERAAALRALAGLFLEGREPAREARTWLRLLAISPNDDQALERLTDIYARAGERERLAAVLSLRIEREARPEDRTRGLLLLAAAHLREPADEAAAERIVRRALAEAAGGSPNAEEAAALARRWGHPELAERLLEAEADADSEAEAEADSVADSVADAESDADADSDADAASDADPDADSDAEADPDSDADSVADADADARDPESQTAFEAHLRQKIEAGIDPGALLELAREGLARFPASGELLLAFEAAAISMGAVDVASSTFERLADVAVGDHGRRGLRYRQAVCMERLGAAERALEGYRAAFSLAPGDGLVFRAMERVAGELGRFDVMVDGYLALVERTPHVDRRLALLRQTADICERSLGNPGRAFDLLFETFQSTGRSDLVADLRRIGRGLLENDRARGESAYGRLLDALTARIEGSWNADDRIRCLGTVAAIHWEDLGAHAAAISAADRATEIARSEPDCDLSEAADIAWQLAEWLLAADELEEARTRARAALELSPGHAQAESLLASMTDSDDAALEPESSAIPTPPAPKPVEFAPERTPASAPPLAESSDAEESRLRAVANGGDRDAALALAAVIGRDPARLREAAQLVLAIVRAEPFRAGAWTALWKSSSLAGATNVAEVAQTVVSIFDPSVEAPSDPFSGQGTALVGQRREILSDPDLERVAPALEALWRGAMPLFRRAIGYYGVVATQRLSPYTQRPVTEAYVAAIEALGLEDVPVYMRRAAERDVLVAPTQPISLVVSDGIESAPDRMMFRMGRALSLATPAHVLVATLDFDDLRVLLEALEAAFGPPDRVGHVSHPAASLAADLWHTVPAREQARLRDAMSTLAPGLDPFRVRDGVFAQAARSGLLVAERLKVSIEAVFSDEATLRGHAYDTAHAFERAVRASEPLAALLRTALSDDYLAARARARDGRH